MTLNKRLQRRLKLIVMGASAVVFVFMIVLCFQFVMRTSNSRQEARLQAQNEELQRQIDEVLRETYHIGSEGWILDYLRNQLGLGMPGEVIIVRP